MEWAEELNDVSFFCFSSYHRWLWHQLWGYQRCIWPQSGTQTKEGQGLEGLETARKENSPFKLVEEQKLCKLLQSTGGFLGSLFLSLLKALPGPYH